MSTVLEVKNLDYVYNQGLPNEHRALENVSFSVEQGEIIGIIGSTGSGKSTLVQHLNGLLKPTSGNIIIDGEDIWENKTGMRDVRFKVGLVFQYPEYQLFEETVYKDIAFGPKNMGLDETEIDRRVKWAASFVGTTEDRMEKSPFDLSGGQKRRVALAGVIAMDPKILVLDEPTVGLDPAGSKEILDEIDRFHEQNGTTVIMVSHSMNDIARLTDRVLVLNEGRVYAYGKTSEIFAMASELQSIGLAMPAVTEVLLELRRNGLPVTSDALSVEEAAQNIISLLHTEATNC